MNQTKVYGNQELVLPLSVRMSDLVEFYPVIDLMCDRLQV